MNALMKDKRLAYSFAALPLNKELPQAMSFLPYGRPGTVKTRDLLIEAARLLTPLLEELIFRPVICKQFYSGLRTTVGGYPKIEVRHGTTSWRYAISIPLGDTRVLSLATTPAQRCT